jgi:N-acetylglucosaminyl-diphospho-decaprenol L-rhamnosyltransferase
MEQQVLSPTINQQLGEPVFDVSIILVCWNNKSYLEPCLQSLYNTNMQFRFETIVVDNGSTDGSQAMLNENFPDVRIIQNDSNVGLSKASNQGIETTSGKYVLLLNNDTIVNGLSLNSMVAFLDSHPDAGAVGGRLLNPDGSFQAGYAVFSSLIEEIFIATRVGEYNKKGYPSHYDTDRVMPVGWLSSACLMVRRAALDQVGLLDEEYFIYGDEADLQYRLNRSGWKVYYLPEATTIHYGGRSMDRWRRRKMVYRGKMLFYKKNYGILPAFMLRLVLGLISILKLVIWVILSILPNWNTRAKKEIHSNLEVIGLCLKLG